MEQKKIGSFLRELRKERGLTQEQLAEQFHVSGRSVSRWENGNNMPDLSLLVELADFYDVEVRELIDGERKSENMNKEEKETLLKIADYTDNEKESLLKKLRIFAIVGVCAMIVNFIMEAVAEGITLPVFDFIRGMTMGVTFGTLIIVVVFSTGILAQVYKSKEKKMEAKLAGIICILLSMVCFIIAMVSFL